MFDPKQLDNFPFLPGVYLMKDKNGDILYVGKARLLRHRLKQYFVPGRDSRPSIPFLVSKVDKIETIVVSSEKEALLLENTLIKKHQPKYNALLKDDKSYISLRISIKQEWPKLELIRYKGKPPAEGLYFGPYMNVHIARELMDLLQRLFPLRMCSDRELATGKPCFYYQLKRCPGPCAGMCTKEEYAKNVKRTIQFLRGQDKEVLAGLYSEMQAASEAMEFEKAAALLRTIGRLERALETQYVHRIMHGDADAIGLYRQAEKVVLVQLLFRSGKLVGSQSFEFNPIAEDNDELLSSFILQNYQNKEDLPHEILVSIDLEDMRPLEELISEGKNRKTHLLLPQRGDKVELVELANQNAKATFEAAHDAKASLEKTLLEMQEKLHLSRYPRRIECFDNSHLSGSNSVSSMVVFVDGEKKNAEYRRYRLRTASPSDDYGALQEVLTRRFLKAKDEDTPADLLLIDGGKGQLNIAIKILEELELPPIDIVAIAKEESRHDKGATLERLFLPNVRDPVILNRHSPILFLIQKIRDEAHRFAINYQRKVQSRSTLSSSIDEIPGIGPVKKKRLLTHFGSIKRLQQASQADLKAVKGLNSKDIELLLHWSKSKKWT